VLYTDQPLFFNDFFLGETRVHVEAVSMEQISRWRGAINFVHRVKIEILMDAARKFSGPLFYADGDTYFLSSPTSLFSEVNEQTSLMHIAESSLAKGKDPISKKMSRFVRRNVFLVDGQGCKIDPQTTMWNAGVIGVAEKNRNIFSKILQLTDEMHAKYPKHVTEQLAVSYFLQTTTKVIPADQVIYHYWNQKPEYQIRIDRFLEKNVKLEGAIKAYSSFDFPERPEPHVRLFKRLLRKLIPTRALNAS
jgi:hypothetical protein